MVAIEVVGGDNGVLNLRRERCSMRVIGGEMCLSESGVERVRAELNTTWTNCILNNSGKMVGFAGMGIHLGLLSEACGTKLLMRADGGKFDGRLMRSELTRIVYVCLICRFWSRRDEGA